MNFYDFYQPGETLDESPIILAAKDLMKHGLQVLPLIKNEKIAANVKSIYELISHPINEKNFDYYFANRDVDLGMILTDDMEFIDVDEKNKPGITKGVLYAVEMGWPELYEKLVIDITPSGGCHLLYRAEQVGGKSALAKVPSRPNPLTIIERISRHSHKQYIKIAPSEGYRLIQRSPLDIQWLTAEERNWLCGVCMSFNEVIIPEVKKPDTEREDSPWNEFNRRNDWKYIRNELVDRNWQIVSDMPDRVILKRPGQSMQRASGKIFKDKNVLYLFTVSTEFEDGKSYTPFGVYTLFYHDGNVALACKQLASEGCGKNNLEEGQFWKKNKSKIEIKYTELLNWLHQIGYRKYKESIVQIVDNIIELTDEVAMKRAFLNETEFEIQDRMYEKVGTIFSQDGGLLAMLKELDDNFIRDDKSSTWIFFKNLAIEITASSINPHEYKSLKSYIWKSSIIERDFYRHDYVGCDADKFINIICNGNKEGLQKTIGYSLSRFKDVVNPRAIIITEDIDPEDEGEAQGGSGKGLLFKFIAQFRKYTSFDGKTFNPQNNFLYQSVQQDTSIIFIDDVVKNFKFEYLYSIITEDLHINRKNKPEQIIPFDKSPKIWLNSNYTVGSMDISSVRRKMEFAIKKYFDATITPIKEFGHEFFTSWDRNEWLMFDNLIVHCCQLYLSDNNQTTNGNVTENSLERSLISNTNRDFIDYMDSQLQRNFFDFAPDFLKTLSIKYPDGSSTSNAVNIQAYINCSDNPDYYFTISKEAFYEKVFKICHSPKWLTTTKLTQWLKRWAESRGVEINARYRRSNDDNISYRIVVWPYSLYEKTSDNDKNQSDEKWRPNEKW